MTACAAFPYMDEVLTMATRHLVTAAECVSGQEKRVKSLEQLGIDTRQSERLLVTFRELQKTFEEQYQLVANQSVPAVLAA